MHLRANELSASTQCFAVWSLALANRCHWRAFSAARNEQVVVVSSQVHRIGCTYTHWCHNACMCRTTIGNTIMQSTTHGASIAHRFSRLCHLLDHLLSHLLGIVAFHFGSLVACFGCNCIRSVGVARCCGSGRFCRLLGRVGDLSRRFSHRCSICLFFDRRWFCSNGCVGCLGLVQLWRGRWRDFVCDLFVYREYRKRSKRDGDVACT